MDYEWDAAKGARNVRERGIPFEWIGLLDWERTLVMVDNRRDYPETRYVGIGPIGSRLHVVIFTRRMQAIRVISLRRANGRERKRYEAETNARAPHRGGS